MEEMISNSWQPSTYRICNKDSVMTGITDCQTPTIALLAQPWTRAQFQEPVMVRNTIGSHVTHHIYPDDGGTKFLKHWILTPYLHG